jgi:hypothetical protein
MKKTLAILFLFFCTINSYSQEVIWRDTVFCTVDSSWYEFKETLTKVEVDSSWATNRLSLKHSNVVMSSYRSAFFDEVIFCFRPDIMFNNFEAFESELGKHNVDYLNGSGLMVSVGLSARRDKYLYGLVFGFLPVTSYNKQDSLDIRLNSTRFGINFGVDVVNSRRFIVTPQINLHWNRYRLINSNRDRISLQQYMSEREVDLRFNQTTVSMGLNISYKIYNTKGLTCDYWTIGLFGGYIVGLNSKPWIYSHNHRLKNEHRTNLQNYTFGFYMSFHLRVS